MTGRTEQRKTRRAAGDNLRRLTRSPRNLVAAFVLLAAFAAALGIAGAARATTVTRMWA